jgi:galactosyltransferase
MTIEEIENEMLRLGVLPATKLPPQRDHNAPPLRVLIAVAGCHKYRFKANNQRATWVKDAVGADVRFFVGHPIDDRTPLADEVWLDCPDDYQSRKLKVLAIVRWALAHGYEYLWLVDDDVYLRPERLLALEPFDYCGFQGLVKYQLDGRDFTFLSVLGACRGLSKRAMECLLAPDVMPNFNAYEEGWVCKQLEHFGIRPFNLRSWMGWPLSHGCEPVTHAGVPKLAPEPTNFVIASFEYTPEQMLAIHQV